MFGTTSAPETQELDMAISFEKIFIVAGFLLILLAVQLFFKFRANGEEFLRKKSSQISLKSRLNLSSKERVDLLEVDGKSILIVFARNAQPSILEFSDDVIAPEGRHLS
jgi:flagellar biogenesis protein FliO